MEFQLNIKAKNTSRQRFARTVKAVLLDAINNIDKTGLPMSAKLGDGEKLDIYINTKE